MFSSLLAITELPADGNGSTVIDKYEVSQADGLPLSHILYGTVTVPVNDGMGSKV